MTITPCARHALQAHSQALQPPHSTTLCSAAHPQSGIVLRKRLVLRGLNGRQRGCCCCTALGLVAGRPGQQERLQLGFIAPHLVRPVEQRKELSQALRSTPHRDNMLRISGCKAEQRHHPNILLAAPTCPALLLPTCWREMNGSLLLLPPAAPKKHSGASGASRSVACAAQGMASLLVGCG